MQLENPLFVNTEINAAMREVVYGLVLIVISVVQLPRQHCKSVLAHYKCVSKTFSK